MKHRTISALLTAVLAAAFLTGGCSLTSGSAPSASAPGPAASKPSRMEASRLGQENPPPYRAESADGKTVTDEIYKGRTAVVTVGATWCPDCCKEFPVLRDIYNKYKDNPDVVVLTTIAVDGEKETRESALAYFKEQGLNLPLYFADNDYLRETYRVHYIPTVFVIGRDGKTVELRAEHTGLKSYYFIEEATEAALDEAIQRGMRAG